MICCDQGLRMLDWWVGGDVGSWILFSAIIFVLDHG